jgi:hypothetical protein
MSNLQMKLSVLYFPHREGHNSIFPLLAYRQALEYHGISIHLYTNTDSFLSSKSDVWIVSGFSLPKLLHSKDITISRFLKNCHDRNVPLIYLSGSDSTGPFDHEVIQWVDLYLAKQLVRDKSFYLNDHRRHLFRDRYFRDYRFRNQNNFPVVNYSKEEISKLGLSWNLGLIDWKTQTSSRFIRYSNILFRNGSFPEWNPGKDLVNRGIDLMFRGNFFSQSHDACRLHRLQTYRVYQKEALNQTTVPSGLVSNQAYRRELASSKICLSPFGWGEICYRDFEAFQSRTLLFKPDMSHLETFPDFYSQDAMVTYDWDARNLSDKIGQVLGNVRNYQDVADAGFEKFQKWTNGTGAEASFTIHLKKQLENSIQNFSLR